VTRLREFNELDPAAAAEILRPCLDVDRWVTGVVDARPYATVDDLLATARRVADPFTPVDLEAALAHHPRIGERATGDSAEANLSRAEQEGLGPAPEDGTTQRLAEGNRAYEERFGRVFLIRAAGRSSSEILDQLQVRLANDVETEDEVVADQLRQIALIRLAGVVDR
jgi:OHCU decarboxylase